VLLSGGVIQHGATWFIDHSMDKSSSGRGSVCLLTCSRCTTSMMCGGMWGLGSCGALPAPFVWCRAPEAAGTFICACSAYLGLTVTGGQVPCVKCCGATQYGGTASRAAGRVAPTVDPCQQPAHPVTVTPLHGAAQQEQKQQPRVVLVFGGYTCVRTVDTLVLVLYSVGAVQWCVAGSLVTSIQQQISSSSVVGPICTACSLRLQAHVCTFEASHITLCSRVHTSHPIMYAASHFQLDSCTAVAAGDSDSTCHLEGHS
jgi:hypothetical protein